MVGVTVEMMMAMMMITLMILMMERKRKVVFSGDDLLYRSFSIESL
uniref:Uncharacterized protein n=1 Tax=Arundo donax TaxID=35708 RepID=A0A0A9DR16_ARUDO